MPMPKMILQKLNLSQISGVLVVSVVLLCGLLISTLTYNGSQSLLEQQLRDDVERQLRRLATVTAPILMREDRVSLTVTLNDWASSPAITSLRILNNRGDILARSGQPSKGTYSVSRTVNQDDLAIGVIQADVSLKAAYQSAGRYFSLALVATALLSLISGLIFYRLAYYPSHYLTRLSRHLQQSDDELILPLPTAPRLQECLALQGSLTIQAERQKQQKTLQQALNQFMYQPDTELETGTTYRDCAILYLEIPNLETLQQSMSATELAASLNQYHRLITHAAKVYNGRLDRYQGDGIVVIFGLHEHNERDSLHCIYAASLFLGLLRYLRIKGREPADFEFRCAAHRGPVLVAPIHTSESEGETSEEPECTQYNLIGDSLYWASHLARHGDDDHLLASESLVSQLPDEQVKWRTGPDIPNFQGDPQSSFWLKSMPEDTLALINRQIYRIASITEDIS